MKYASGHDEELKLVFNDLLMKMTDALSMRDYVAYSNEVDHLGDLGSMSATKDEYDHIRTVKRMHHAYVKSLICHRDKTIESSPIVKSGQEREIEQTNNHLRAYYVEYPLYRLLARIYMHALKRTQLKALIPDGGTEYKISEDMKFTFEEIGLRLIENGIEQPPEVLKWLE